ncbi:hypothetical protein [Effusibacillus consociatus]|uniref:Uncharacterized protein n=1 Tax=Effusibacillus consociatus TaxID=1117041 RepID=A0ABV9Q3E8_9BACL
MPKDPPGIKFQEIYEPDMEKMVQALRIVLESPSGSNEKEVEASVEHDSA